MAWAVTHTGASPTGSSGVSGRPLRVLAAAHCMPRCRLAFVCVQICSQRVLHGAEKKLHNSAKRHVAHRPSPTPRPRHCHARARCSAPSTRARACRARSSHTLHACEPRQRRTCSHIATRACTSCQKARCVLDVTGHWQIVGRPAADTSGMHTQYIALAIAAARDPHALPTRCACHPPPPTLSPYAER